MVLDNHSRGDTTATIDVPTYPDANAGNGTSFDVSLQNASDGGDNFYTEGAGTATLEQPVNVNIGNAATVTTGQTASFQLTLSQPCSSPATISYHLQDGSASAGLNYIIPTAESTTIPTGSTVGWIDVQTDDNAVDEPYGDYFGVQLQGASDTSGDDLWAGGSATATIVNPTPPSVTTNRPVERSFWHYDDPHRGSQRGSDAKRTMESQHRRRLDVHARLRRRPPPLSFHGNGRR